MLSNDEVLEAIRSVRIEGPTIPLVSIPAGLRNELISTWDLSRVELPDVPGGPTVDSAYFSFWCGQRLHPNYEPPATLKHFSDAEVESLSVRKRPLQPKEIKANFKAGAYLIDLMRENQVYASVAFGYLRDHSFEMRHYQWICTSMIIGIWEKEDEYWIYTKSGSIYSADSPMQHVQLPLEKLPLLRKGLSPAHIEVVKKIEAEGNVLIDVVSE